MNIVNMSTADLIREVDRFSEMAECYDRIDKDSKARMNDIRKELDRRDYAIISVGDGMKVVRIDSWEYMMSDEEVL